MPVGYTKLFSEIIASTVWREPDHVRLVWITMLALKDRWHIVSASIPGLADFAKVGLEQCEEALEVLSSPDTYSRTKENEGRRIKRVEGGWLILNGEKYRNKMSLDERREYQRIKQSEYRKKDKEKQHLSLTCQQSSQRFTHTEADTEADKRTTTTLSDKSDDALTVLSFLNEKSGRAYRPVGANLDLIKARLKEGYTVQDLKTLTARKCREWREDDTMKKFMRPATLYNKTKCAQYIGECVEEKK